MNADEVIEAIEELIDAKADARDADEQDLGPGARDEARDRLVNAQVAAVDALASFVNAAIARRSA